MGRTRGVQAGDERRRACTCEEGKGKGNAGEQSVGWQKSRLDASKMQTANYAEYMGDACSQGQQNTKWHGNGNDRRDTKTYTQHTTHTRICTQQARTHAHNACTHVYTARTHAHDACTYTCTQRSHTCMHTTLAHMHTPHAHSARTYGACPTHAYKHAHVHAHERAF
eukprot:356542-Chlamydomonas_euryale.AAC.8